jgi:ParB family chromosome partitioning protein
LEFAKKKTEIQTLDELFGISPTQEERDDAKREKVTEILRSEIDSFPDHPFQVNVDESMLTLVESIKQYGVLVPAVVRQKEDGRYEYVAGHRRDKACELAGIETIPCIIRQMSRDEAIIAMVDSNLQRETILPSEKAKSYKMRYEAMKRQAGRPNQNNYSPLANNLAKTSSAELAEQLGTSKDQIYRFIRLNELIPQLLEMVDNSVVRDKNTPQIAIRPAVELSYLTPEQQKILLITIESEECTPSHAQAIKMRRFSEAGRLDEDVMLSIMTEEKANQADNFKIPREKIARFFDSDTPADKIEETIIKALELWRTRTRERNDAR